MKVLHLPVPQFLDRGVVGWSFGAAVPALVVVGPVAVVLAVGLVVFPLYETRSLRLNPSWQVTKLMLCSASRSLWP